MPTISKTTKSKLKHSNSSDRNATANSSNTKTTNPKMSSYSILKENVKLQKRIMELEAQLPQGHSYPSSSKSKGNKEDETSNTIARSSSPCQFFKSGPKVCRPPGEAGRSSKPGRPGFNIQIAMRLGGRDLLYRKFRVSFMID